MSFKKGPRLPSKPQVILCGGVPAPKKRRGLTLHNLSLADPDGNIGLKIRDISEKAIANIPDVLLDLIDVASYVYCADQAVTRGGNGVRDMGAAWRREFHFHIPVRQKGLWERESVRSSLREMLGFLSDDTYQFVFHELEQRPSADQYFDFGDDGYANPIDSVMLFSGGLDSLGGVVAEAITDRKRLALVSHRSNPKLDSRQRNLVTALKAKCTQNPPLHVPVWLSKHGAPEAEHTQRSRSFLYAALATVVARLFGHGGFRFYENGVISLNLPICEQVVGARATRSTHPRYINNLERFLSDLLGGPFRVENPFLWLTKTEIINLIGDAGCADLIAQSISCVHTRDQTIAHTHCGKCSQCVHRRFSALASRFGDSDPAEMYARDLLTEERTDVEEQTLVQTFVDTARFMQQADEIQFLRKYGEVGRIVKQVGLPSAHAAERIHDLHRRHGCEVGRVLTDAISKYAPEIWAKSLSPTCAVAVAASQQTDVAAEPKKPVQQGEGTMPSSTQPGEKPLTPKDAAVLKAIGNDPFFKWQDKDILRTYKKELAAALDGASDEARRSSLRRIRDHLRAPGSRELQKKRSEKLGGIGQRPSGHHPVAS